MFSSKGWLEDDAKFKFVKNMFVQKRVLRFWMNITDHEGLKILGDWMKKYGHTLDVVYVSNPFSLDIFLSVPNIGQIATAGRTLVISSTQPATTHVYQRIDIYDGSDLDVHSSLRRGARLGATQLLHPAGVSAMPALPTGKGGEVRVNGLTPAASLGRFFINVANAQTISAGARIAISDNARTSIYKLYLAGREVLALPEDEVDDRVLIRDIKARLGNVEELRQFEDRLTRRIVFDLRGIRKQWNGK